MQKNEKYNSNNIGNKHNNCCKIIIIILLAIIVAIIILTLIAKKIDVTVANIVTNILSAIIGGGFTFLGVKLTIKHDIEQKEKELIENYRPKFFELKAPDVSKALNITFNQENEKNIMSNHIFYFKNSDKIAFKINYIEIEEKRFYPKTQIYIDKDAYFSIRVNYKKEFDKLKLNVLGLNGKTYNITYYKSKTNNALEYEE